MKTFRVAFMVTAVIVVGCAVCAAAPAKTGAAALPILPDQFGGWTISGSVKTSTDPAAADPTSAAVLKEYGFEDFSGATYARDDGHKLTIKAARFADASGAYGAFTYYKTPQMQIEKIGDQAGSLNERVLFYRGNILVDAVFQQLSAMSAAELRELAGDLPLPSGATRNLPGLPAYLPAQSYVPNTAKYVVGPGALQNVHSPLPADLVDFSAGAELVLGKYNTSGGEAILTLISYPTPQIAAAHLRSLDAVLQQHPLPPDSPLANLGPVYDKRTGPILVIATGSLSTGEAKSLLASVNYDASVTWNENTYATRKDNLANLLLNIIYLCGILIGFALVAGLAFGGARVLLRRLFPDRVFERAETLEFISLHLSEPHPGPAEDGVNSSIKAV